MLKFLRWLLVPLFPLLGLFVGVWLMPERKPRWQFYYDYVINVLGHVDDGQTLLIAEVTSKGEQSLIGINVETGKERFRIALTRELLEAKANQIREARLSDDGKYVLFPAEHPTLDSKKQIMLFDWNEKRVTQRFWLDAKDILTSVCLRGTRLVACDHANLFIWNTDQPQLMERMSLSPSSNPIGLSNDSGIVHHVELQLGDRTIQYQLALYDVVHFDKLEPIPNVMHPDVSWSEDSQSFKVICHNPLKGGLISRTFLKDETGFNPVPEMDRLLIAQGYQLSDQHFFAIASSARFDPLRMKLDKWIGPTFSPLLDRLWPDAQALQLYDRNSITLLYKLTVPLGFQAFRGLKINSHPQGLGIALWEQRWIQYWGLHHISRWPPLLGLLAGLLLSTLLAWKLLQHTSRMNSKLSPSGAR